MKEVPKSEINFIHLKERIAISREFSPAERDLILEALNLRTQHDTDRHTYPRSFPPGTNPFADAAWEILDTLRPGQLDRAARFQLGGAIAGALEEALTLGMRTAKATKQ